MQPIVLIKIGVMMITMTGIDVSEYIKTLIDKNVYREFVKFLIQHDAYSFYLYKLSTVKYKIDTNRFKRKIPYDSLISMIMGSDEWDNVVYDSRMIMSLGNKWLRQINGG